MEDFDREQREEMKMQASLFISHIKDGKKVWFDSDNYIDIIEYFVENKNDDMTKAAILEAYKYFPYNEEIVSQYASFLASKNEIEKAIKLLSNTLKKVDSEDMKIDLATMCIDNQIHVDEALEILLDIIKHTTDNPFVYALIGRVYIDKQKYILAESFIRKGLMIDNEDALLLGTYTNCVADESLRNKMIDFLKQLSSNNPFNDNVWTALSVVYLGSKRYKEALQAIDFAIAITPKGETKHSCRADCLVFLDDFPQAIEEFRKAISYSTEFSAELHLHLAAVLMQQKRYKEAVTEFELVQKESPNDFDPSNLLDLSLCYCFIGQSEKSREGLKKAIKDGVSMKFFLKFAKQACEYGYTEDTKNLLMFIVTTSNESEVVQEAGILLANLKLIDEDTYEAIKVLHYITNKLDGCGEEFWYEFLKITCTDKKYDDYSIRILGLLKTLDDFPEYLKENYPELITNDNYIRCLKAVYKV